jgi:hypothetical protein
MQPKVLRYEMSGLIVWSCSQGDDMFKRGVGSLLMR